MFEWVSVDLVSTSYNSIVTWYKFSRQIFDENYIWLCDFVGFSELIIQF